MKKALISNLEPGRVCDVVEVGQEFETTVDFYWVDCPDDTLTSHTYNQETGEFKAFNVLEQEDFIRDGYKVARAIAYGSIGNQLDMIYKEIAATGTVSADGAWATMVADVKATIPKDDPAAVLAWYEQQNSNNT